MTVIGGEGFIPRFDWLFYTICIYFGMNGNGKSEVGDVMNLEFFFMEIISCNFLAEEGMTGYGE